MGLEQRSPAQREKIRILEAQRQALLAERIERQIRDAKRAGTFF